MTCRGLTPILMVEKVNYSIDFYNNILGFDFVLGVLEESKEVVTAWSKEQSLDFCIIRYGDAEIMFQSRNSFGEDFPKFRKMKVGGSLNLYIEVDNIKSLYKNIKSKVSIVKKLEIKFYGMKEFYIQDCNGYILGFVERPEAEA